MNRWQGLISILIISTACAKSFGPGVVALRQGFTVNQGDTLILKPGTILKVGPRQRIVIDGLLIANGTTKRPIYFTSILDDRKGGDTDKDGGADLPMPGEWGPVFFGKTSQVTMSYCQFRFLAGPLKILSSTATCDKILFHECTFKHVISRTKPIEIGKGSLTYHWSKAQTLAQAKTARANTPAVKKRRHPVPVFVIAPLSVAAISGGVFLTNKSWQTNREYQDFKPGNPEYDAMTNAEIKTKFADLRKSVIVNGTAGGILTALGVAGGVYTIMLVIKF